MPHRDDHDVVKIPFFVGVQDPADLTADRETQLGPEAEGAGVLVQALLAQSQSELRRAAVAGVADDLRHGKHAHLMVFPGQLVVAGAARDPLLRAVKGRGRRDQPLLERAGGGHDLEYRTRLVDVGHRRIFHPRHLLLRHLVIVVGVEGRVVAHPEDEPGARVAHNDRCLQRLKLVRDESQFLLHDILHDQINREQHAETVRRRHLAGQKLRQLAAAAVAFADPPTLLATEKEIQVGLDAGGGLLLLVHVAENVRGELVVRIGAVINAVAVDPLDPQLLHLEVKQLRHILA